MGADAASVIVALAQAGDCEDDRVGGKARTLGRLIDAGYRVPAGFVIDTRAYTSFVHSAGLAAMIQMELGRKPLASMRWEEIWDAALRIRAAFLGAAIPPAIADAIRDAHAKLSRGSVAVRSSAPGEDSSDRSYAGLHESLVGVENADALLDAVRIVWASLWSDAALLYRRELQLDVAHSRMAIVVQEFITASVSGVGFGVDPRRPEADREVVEAVPGLCEDLVSGAVDPDRWILKRSSGEIVEWRAGDRHDDTAQPILERADLETLHQILRSVESFLGRPPDVEWTGRSGDLTLLQARPVTGPREDDDERTWYLSLRPSAGRLKDLCTRVSEQLIPALEAEVTRFARENLDDLTDSALADALENRLQSYRSWKKIYKDEFIPFAHGVRHFGMYYNDTVQPDDPYEFVSLLEHQPMLASRRSAALSRLASQVTSDANLAKELRSAYEAGSASTPAQWREASRALRAMPAGSRFCDDLEAFLVQHMDIRFGETSFDERPDLTLGIVLQLAEDPKQASQTHRLAPEALEQRFLAVIGPERRDEALDFLRIARLSWRLRDDDNILIGRLENQLHHAVARAAQALQRQGRLASAQAVGIGAAPTLIEALRNPSTQKIQVPELSSEKPAEPSGRAGEKPRQIIGQPAARGIGSGYVRTVREASDFREFKRGEVMVCDAIQPTMTHLVPLASAIVERRGGMLIHGAIIARELGIPCVNGVADATRVLRNGDWVTVDGNLGIVTVGPPEFDLERQTSALEFEDDAPSST